MAGKLAGLEKNIPILDAQILDLATLKNQEMSGIPTVQGSCASHQWRFKNQKKTHIDSEQFNACPTANIFQGA